MLEFYDIAVVDDDGALFPLKECKLASSLLVGCMFSNTGV